MANPVTFGFLDQLVRINFPQGGGFMIGGNRSGVQPNIQTSSDGTSWDDNSFSTLGLASNAVAFSAAYGGNVWLVSAGPDSGSDQAQMFKSSDGAKTWVEAPSPPTSDGYFTKTCMTFGQNTFIMADYGNNIWRSTNAGASWSLAAQAPNVDEYVATSAHFLNNKFFVCFSTAGNVALPGIIMSSADGISWTSSSVFSGVSHVQAVAYSTTVQGVAYGNGKYVAIGVVVAGDVLQRYCLITATSSDGVSWATGSTIQSMANGLSGLNTRGIVSKNTIAFGNGVFVVAGSKFILLGPPVTSDIPFGTPVSGITTEGNLLYSSDGLNFTAVAPFPQQDYLGPNQSDGGWQSVLFNNNAFVAVGFEGDASNNFVFTAQTAYSTDGKTWTITENDMGGTPVPQIYFIATGNISNT